MDREPASLQRQFSVDDIVGGIWKLGTGFARTDSEAAFQDFLKRIPSTTNLAGQAQQLDQAQQLQLQQIGAQFQHASQHGLHALAQNGSCGDLPAGLGIPRVPSLDLLRQLVQVNQAMSPPPAKAPATSAAEVAARQVSSAELARPPQSVQMVSTTAPVFTTLPAAASLSLGPANIAPAVAAAALQGLGQLPSVPPLHQPAPQPVKQQPQAHSRRAAEPAEAKPKQERPVLEIKEGATKAEIRRARRMLSNRESARRSRRRKQEHLSTLEEQVNEVTREKEELLDKLDKAEEEAEKFEADNKVLKRRVEELEQEVESLRSQRGEVGSKMPRSPSMQRTASLEPLKKRAHTANGLSVKQEEANGRQ